MEKPRIPAGSPPSNGLHYLPTRLLLRCYRILYHFFLKFKTISKPQNKKRHLLPNNTDPEKASLNNIIARPTYAIGVDGWPVKTNPVHETITLASLLAASFPSLPANISYTTTPPQIWELLRGNIWNDDPSCALFNDSNPSHNHTFAFPPGAAWYKDFAWAQVFGSTRDGSIIGRAHFGDLQFLHGMSCIAGEPAEETRDKILLWCEVMYKLSIGEGITGEERIEDVKIQRGVWRLDSFFGEDTAPDGERTLGYLLARGSGYEGLNLRWRALGSVLHVVQDSYAKGHTRREVVGSSEKWVHLGPVITFHCYRGQNGSQHKSYDTIDTDNIDLSDLNEFNQYWGVRSAVEACARVIKLWLAEKAWEDGPARELERIFRLAKGYTPGDSSIE
ncbi:hypothetical protein TWF694_011045 [Orbilia ellipsospora]|uniref:Uncharacterized protein n=1 Tax=Orbilia ellipsospora TaxID=2528407 RepID=A0AAV9X7V0_9PEZI